MQKNSKFSVINKLTALVVVYTFLFLNFRHDLYCFRHDLYCVEWGVKLYSNQPTFLSFTASPTSL